MEVVRRPLSGSERANEVYAIRDLTDWPRIGEELRRQNEALHEREEELRAQNRRFGLSLANMPHGLCMIDRGAAAPRLQQAFAEMYRLPPELSQPGASLEDIYAYCVGKGSTRQAEADQYYSEGCEAVLEPSVRTRHLCDGRIIRITRQPTEEGGWITVHEDMTENEQLNARLEEQNQLLQRHEAELRSQNANLDMALANMSQGLAMFDAEERLVLANERYAEIYGLEAQHLRPGTTLRELVEYRISKGLYPGLTADDVLQNMRERVARKHAEPPRQPAGRRARAVGLDPAAHRRRMGGDAAGHHRARAAQCAPGGAERSPAAARGAAGRTEYALRCRHRQHVARHVPLRRRSSGSYSPTAAIAEIYGLTPEQVKPGTTLRQIFEARAASGTMATATGEFVRNGLERFRSCKSEVLKLGDGRFISVVRRPMPDGGLLSTHEDITEREQLNARFPQQTLVEREQS